MKSYPSRVVFVHGFMSGEESTKWKYLVENFSDKCEVVIIKNDFRTERPQDVYAKLLTNLRFDDIVVGHSLGGFWTRTLQNEIGYSSILVNPCFIPCELLFNGGERSIPEIYKDGYALLQSRLADNRAGSEYVLLEMGDEIINHETQLNHFRNSDLTMIEGGNHSFLSLDMIGKTIERQVNQEWK